MMELTLSPPCPPNTTRKSANIPSKLHMSDYLHKFVQICRWSAWDSISPHARNASPSLLRDDDTRGPFWKDTIPSTSSDMTSSSTSMLQSGNSSSTSTAAVNTLIVADNNVDGTAGSIFGETEGVFGERKILKSWPLLPQVPPPGFSNNLDRVVTNGSSTPGPIGLSPPPPPMPTYSNSSFLNSYAFPSSYDRYGSVSNTNMPENNTNASSSTSGGVVGSVAESIVRNGISSTFSHHYNMSPANIMVDRRSALDNNSSLRDVNIYNSSMHNRGAVNNTSMGLPYSNGYGPGHMNSYNSASHPPKHIFPSYGEKNNETSNHIYVDNVSKPFYMYT